MTRLRALLADDSGAELVEFALVLPILLLVFVGIVDFGFLFRDWEVVTNAAREGARIAVLPGYHDADVQVRVRSYLLAGKIIDGSVSTLNDCSGGVPPCYRVETLNETLVGGNAIQVKKITVQSRRPMLFIAPITRLIGGSGSFGSVDLSGVSVMRVEAPAGGGS